MSKKTDPTLNKCEELINRLQELKKALTVQNVSSNRRPVGALGVGWSMDPGTGAFHHSTHGIISTSKNPDGGYSIKHGGRAVGQVADMNEAGAKIKNYVSTLQPGDTGMHNVDPMKPTMKSEDEEDKKKKKLTPAQQAAVEEAKRLRKNAESRKWIQHAAVPNADAEVQKLQVTNPAQKAENLMANQLANLMQGKAMLGQKPPAQPTDQEMFGHLVVTEEMEKAAEAQWQGNAFNNFLKEATKPISSRFSSPEEEAAYWDSIKVVDRDDGKSGY